jgi:putative nucleotidyltransferase with HDIG domain
MAPTREDAEKLWRKYNSDLALWRHALAVEAVMRRFAEKAGEDPDKWGVIGLVHDIDYEKWPETHCVKAKELLEEAGWPPEYIHAIQSHGWELCVDVKPESYMEKVLYATDELTGFIGACALVRPSRSVMDMEVKSVKNKWKAKAFAAGVRRELIERGAGMIGMELDEMIKETLEAMKTVAPALGL